MEPIANPRRGGAGPAAPFRGAAGLAALILTLGVGPGGALAAGGAAVDQLLQQFGPAPAEPEGSVRLDAWVERRDDGQRLVVVLEPEGRTKLVADPGITITPETQPGVRWQVLLPVRVVDGSRDYLEVPAEVALPFATEHEEPLRILVEYAWCVVDYQCFFAEETLSVATRID